MRRNAMGTAVAVLFGGVLCANAALTPLGGEYPIVGDVPGHQQNPAVAVDSDGGYIVWQNTTANSKSERILLQRLNADFAGIGAPVVASQNASGTNDINPRITMLPDGGAVVTWESGPRGATDVFARFLDQNGNFVTGAVRVNTQQAGIQGDADVAALSSGQVLVVWSSLGQDGDGEGVYGQRFTSRGIRDGVEFLVNQTTARNQSEPAVTALAGDKFAVGWISESSSGRNSSGGINLRANLMARLFNSDGAALGNEYRLNDGNVVISSGELESSSGGGFMAAWVQTDEAAANNLTDVFVKTFDANGLPSANGARHNTYLKGRQDDPELAVLGSEALVAWTSYGQDAGGAGIQGRLSSGGTEFTVNSQGNLHQKAPTIGSNGSNKFVAVWVNTIRADHSILSAQRYLVSTGAAAGNVVDVTAGTVQVVDAGNERRKTNVTQLPTSQPSMVQTQVASMKINPPAPKPESVAPRNVAAAAVAAAQAAAPAPPAAVNPTPAPTTAAAPPAAAAPSAGARTQQLASNSLRQRAQTRTTPRYNLRTPSFNSSTAAQSALMRQAQARSASALSQRSFQRSTAFTRPQPMNPSMTRSAFLRQPLQASAMNRANAYNRSNLRVTQTQPSRTVPQANNLRIGPASTGRSGLTVAGYNRGSTRSMTAADRMSNIRTQSMASAQNARAAAYQPVQASLQRAGTGYQLNYQSQAGARYQVQSSNDRANWRNVGAPRAGQTGTGSYNIQPGGARFYRVVRTN